MSGDIEAEWIQNAANDAAMKLAAARREGVIEGLERALGLMAAWNPQGAIRAEIERLKAEG